MKYRANDPATNREVNASRRVIIAALVAFCEGQAESLTLATLLDPLVLYRKDDFIGLYEQTAVLALQRRKQSGLLARAGTEGTPFITVPVKKA